MIDRAISWRRGVGIATIWLAAAALVHGLFRSLCLPTNLALQEFLWWGILVLVSVPVVSVVAGAVHRSWKVALVVLLAGIVLGYLGVDLFQ